MPSFTNNLCEITLTGTDQQLWSYQVKETGVRYPIAPPAFEVDGTLHTAVLSAITELRAPRVLPNGCTEYAYTGAFADDPSLSLEMIFRLPADNPVLHCCYMLKSETPRRLTKSNGQDALRYLATPLADMPAVTEVRLSEFNEMVHSYCLSERPVEARHFADGGSVMGPMLVASGDAGALLLAYEHGSQPPDAFVQFDLAADRNVTMRAVKANYYNNQPLTPDQPYQTLWLDIAAVPGSENDLARAFRTFVLKHMTFNQTSRQPYIFYNTWAFQERNKMWNGQAFLTSMNQDRIMEEIDIAHRMGIDVFVLDTGWYEKTGDWRVNLSRFPDGLKSVKAKLDSYGMKLGLWFSPTEAAVSSDILRNNADCIQSWHGKQSTPHSVWETEESQHMCLVSHYWEAFADELIRLVHEVGVTYFKWDAIGQYGCDDPRHWHGTAENSEQERADSYAFQQVQAMARVIDRVCEACPEVIVDFDITESQRCVGLAFLASGKYFLINNGPYYGNYDIPMPADFWCNIFVYPGAARTWICRSPLTFDKWIPSVLYLTHYLPDDPENSQILNIASLILGQNGIWGDLCSISEEGVNRFGHLLGLYKQVRDDITASFPVLTGVPGGSPEIHEKIAANGRGAVVIFATAAGKYEYLTANRVDPQYWAMDGVTVEYDTAGRAKITCEFPQSSAKIIYFGVTVS